MTSKYDLAKKIALYTLRVDNGIWMQDQWGSEVF